MSSLATLVQGLPQELIDELHKSTFSVEPAIITIDRKFYKVPSILQVDKSSRTTTARLYYSQNVFEGPTTVVQHWITSIPYEHAEHLSEVRSVERPLVCCSMLGKAGSYEIVWNLMQRYRGLGSRDRLTLLVTKFKVVLEPPDFANMHQYDLTASRVLMHMYGGVGWQDVVINQVENWLSVADARELRDD